MTRIGRVESHVEREGTVSIEPREVLTSLPCEVERVAQAVRAPWGGNIRSTGCLMSALAKPRVAFATTLVHNRWPSCARWRSTSCDERRPPNEASKRDESERGGIGMIDCRC